MRRRVTDPLWKRLHRYYRVGKRAGIFEETTLQGGIRLVEVMLRQKIGPGTAHAIAAVRHPAKPAVVSGIRFLSYAELDAMINRFGNLLLERGIAPGDRVTLMMRNSPEYVALFFALFRIGVAAVHASFHLKARELAYLVRHSESRAVVFGGAQAEVVQEAMEHLTGLPRCNFLAVEPVSGFEDIETLARKAKSGMPRLPRLSNAHNFVYTSGTTGRPKGAVRDMNKDSMANFFNILEVTPFHHNDRHLIVCPIYHSGAQAFMMLHTALGATLYLLPEFDAQGVLKTLCEARIDSVFLVPTMISRILDLPREILERYRPRHLKALFSGAAPFPVTLRDRALAYFGEILYDFYGSTEAGWVTVATSEEMRTRRGTVGRPIAETELAILDEARRPLPPGEVGEIFVRNTMSMEGYFKEGGALDHYDGFVSVGDLGSIDEEGYLFLAGRKTNMVISGGVNIYPAEIEEVLEGHPAVKEATVLGVPDEKWGEALVAFYVPGDPAAPPSDEELKRHCKEHLANFKVPKRFRPLEEIPRNPTGKVLKRLLREMEMEMEAERARPEQR